MFVEENTLELSRKQQRDKALSRFKYVRTCVLARELCIIIRTNRGTFNRDDVQKSCTLVSQLCKEADCTEQSELCHRASRIVSKDEGEYLELCQQSCLKCGEARRSRPKKNTSYVA